jgi:hypothetical protein
VSGNHEELEVNVNRRHPATLADIGGISPQVNMTSETLREFLESHGFRCHGLRKNQVGHLQLAGELAGAPIDILLDTGAASTVIDLAYCHKRQLPVQDTGRSGGGAGGVHLKIYSLGNMSLALDGHQLRSDGIYAVDLTHVNQGLAMRGADRVHAVLGADILTYHNAVIEYASRSLYLLHGPPSGGTS